MKKLSLYVGVGCLVVAAVIFAVASGWARIYSGAFFVLIGVVNLALAKKGYPG